MPLTYIVYTLSIWETVSLLSSQIFKLIAMIKQTNTFKWLFFNPIVNFVGEIDLFDPTKSISMMMMMMMMIMLSIIES